MEGRELLRLLDFVEKLRKEQNRYKIEADEKIGSEKVEPNSKGNAYGEIAKELENILRDLNKIY